MLVHGVIHQCSEVMIFLLDILTHRNMFQKRDTEHKVQM